MNWMNWHDNMIDAFQQQLMIYHLQFTTESTELALFLWIENKIDVGLVNGVVHVKSHIKK
jgi:hypothetical protein